VYSTDAGGRVGGLTHEGRRYILPRRHEPGRAAGQRGRDRLVCLSRCASRGASRHRRVCSCSSEPMRVAVPQDRRPGRRRPSITAFRLRELGMRPQDSWERGKPGLRCWIDTSACHPRRPRTIAYVDIIVSLTGRDEIPRLGTCLVDHH